MVVLFIHTKYFVASNLFYLPCHDWGDVADQESFWHKREEKTCVDDGLIVAQGNIFSKCQELR